MNQLKKEVGGQNKILPINLNGKSLNNLNVFSFDDEIHAGKLFIQLYGEFYNSYSVYANINIEPFIKQLIEKYGLSKENFLIKSEYSKVKKIDEIDYSSSLYLIRIEEKLLVWVSNYKIVTFYSDSIHFDEIKEIVSLVKSCKKEKKHKRKFYMITANSHSEYGFEFRKFSLIR